jgi:hypothetical protein
MFVIHPKCYILQSSKNENDENVKKMKGTFFRLNDNIDLESYKSCLEQSSVPIIGTEEKRNRWECFGQDIILENHSCTPFLRNFTKEVYYFSKYIYYFFYILFTIITFFVIIT